MKKFPALRGFVVLASIGALLTGCSLFGDGPKWGKRGDEKEVAAAPALPEPVATHRFEIEPGTDIVGVVQKTLASKEDTLTDIARRFNVGYEEIVRANPGVDPWLPGEGREIVIPSQFVLPNAPREGIVINAAAMRLFYYPKVKKGEPQVVHTYPIGIGKVGWKTPEGVTKIVRRQKDPTWRPTPSIIKEHLEERGEKLERVIGPGPDNPLGRFAFYLGWPSYMIHGTNKPAGVGLRSSHGCIRLYPEDIAVLFEMAPIGTPVRVVNQPFVFGFKDGALHIQAFDVLEDDPRDWKKAQAKLLNKALADSIRKELAKRQEKIDWEAVAQLSQDPRGIPVSVSGGPDSLENIVVTATLVQNKVAPGATWDGISDLPVDEATFQELVSDREPSVESAAAAATPAKPATN
ncbi:MAG TPA: L,D-transpeptidase family protein [Steroidobacteraceae bacterium]|nr:L,D-transpeptidase family protein [Steroidobacteraceae bacterium]